ncbi:hypothetical protein [Microbacterium sp.]|uniref:hypothetical protein n=1 Tax=Microbacterium sp. TaxID=51671 RepID=UPI002810F9EB|nr:hypothetical protein [Microbacterium sp.]
MSNDADTKPRNLVARQRTWVVGGSLMLLSGAVGIAARGPLAGIAPMKDWLFAAAATLLVVGFSRAGSVTGRRVLGTVSTILLGVAPLTQSYWYTVIPDSVNDDPHAAEDASVHVAMMYYGAVAVLAIVSVVAIVSAKVVPSPWRWAPLWVVIWTPVTFGLGLSFFSSAPLGTPMASIGAIIAGYGPATGVAFLASWASPSECADHRHHASRTLSPPVARRSDAAVDEHVAPLPGDLLPRAKQPLPLVPGSFSR